MLWQQLNDVLPAWNLCWKTGILHSWGENKADTTFGSLSFPILVMLQSWPQPGKAPRVNVTITSVQYVWTAGTFWRRRKTSSRCLCRAQLLTGQLTPWVLVQVKPNKDLSNYKGSISNPLGPCYSDQNLPKWQVKISLGLEGENICSEEHCPQTNFQPMTCRFPRQSVLFITAIIMHIYMDDHAQQTDSKKGRVMGWLNKGCTRNNKQNHMKIISAVSRGGEISLPFFKLFCIFLPFSLPG